MAMENSKMNFLLEVPYSSVGYDPQVVRGLLKNNKVLVLREYRKEESISDFFDTFSDNIGQVIDMDEDAETGAPTGNRWISIAYDEAHQDKYRSAPVAQPLHTDYSYIEVDDNIQFFFCKSRAKFGGATTFIDADVIVDLIKTEGLNDLLERLLNTPVTHTKGGRSKSKPIISLEDGVYKMNWNYYPAMSSNIEKDLVEEFHNFLQTRIVQSGLVSQCLLEQNDCVFFHDSLILHGRNSYFATHKGQRELIKGTLLI